MLCYRYRSGSELCMKELIYDEMFFAKTDECNDPYEGKLFAQFPADKEMWTKLVECVSDGVPLEIREKMINFLCEISPISVDELLGMSEDIITLRAQKILEINYFRYVLLCLKGYIEQYMSQEQYFVCFSKTPDNCLMWSHYANNHRGYCLIFRSVDGGIRQCPTRKRRMFSYNTPQSFSKSMSFEIGDKFMLRNVKYVETPPIINAFMCLPITTNGNKYSKEEIAENREKFENVYYCKHSVWEYEQEMRIVLSSGIPWLLGERMSVSLHKRLFHYDSTQLVGIVFGARMPEEQKNRIREIINEKIENWHDGSRENQVIYDFIIFEEQLSETKRDIRIEPVEICSLIGIQKDDPKFKERFEDWKKGTAIQYEGNSARKIQAP